jgi:hypothetical protein
MSVSVFPRGTESVIEQRIVDLAVPIKIRCSQLVELEPNLEAFRACDIWRDLHLATNSPQFM